MSLQPRSIASAMIEWTSLMIGASSSASRRSTAVTSSSVVGRGLRDVVQARELRDQDGEVLAGGDHGPHVEARSSS